MPTSSLPEGVKYAANLHLMCPQTVYMCTPLLNTNYSFNLLKYLYYFELIA